MSYLVLARKYRPRNFSEMVGQPHVVQALSNALTSGRLHHAYLFTGTRGVGKTTVSRILAKSLNCLGADGLGGITAAPCGVCTACRDIDAGRFVDYTELDAASNRGVDDIAQLLEQAVYKPVLGRFKVFMIDEVHMLTNQAFNAMLKTLEEPPEYLKFVLATTDPQKLLPTVLSRCLQFNLRPMAPDTIFEHLAEVLAAENIIAESAALRLLSLSARGSMRDALSLTDQAIAFGNGTVLETSVRAMLGSIDRSHVYQLLDALAAGDGRSVVQTSEALRTNGQSAAAALEDMVTVLQRMAVLQAVPGSVTRNSGSAFEDDADQRETARLAALMPADETQLLYSICLHGRAELGLSPDEYAGLTMVLLRLLAFKPPPDAATLADRAAHAASAFSAETAKEAAAPEKKPLKADFQASNRAFEQEIPAQAAIKKIAEESFVRPADLPVAALLASRALSPVQLATLEPPPPPQPVEPQLEKQVAPASPDTAEAPVSISPTASFATPASPTKPAEISALGDFWSQTVHQLLAENILGPYTRQIALSSQLVSSEDSRWLLRVASELQARPAEAEKLQAALQRSLNQPLLALTISFDANPLTDTPAQRIQAAQDAKLRAARQAIESDPYVQSLIRDWGAKIIESSIRAV